MADAFVFINTFRVKEEMLGEYRLFVETTPKRPLVVAGGTGSSRNHSSTTPMRITTATNRCTQGSPRRSLCTLSPSSRWPIRLGHDTNDFLRFN